MVTKVRLHNGGAVVFFQVGLLSEALAYHNFVHRYEGQVFKQRPGYLAGCIEAVAAGKPVVKFVRDPAARVFSSFHAKLNPHVAAQFVNYEAMLDPTIVAIEGSPAAFDALADKHALKLLAGAPSDLFSSGHHRDKRLKLQGADLERWLNEPMSLHRKGAIDLPSVDTRLLAGSDIGEAVRRVFAADYKAYPIYG